MSLRLALVALFCLALHACGKPETAASAPGSALLQQAKGRWLLVNYWAEWCKPCLAEIPELNRFQREFGDRAVVYMVNFDGVTGAALQEQVKKLGIEVQLLETDPAAELGFQRPQALPSTFVFGPDGQLKDVLQGEQTFDALAAAIAAPAAAPAP